jgi:hypothetical protein
MKVVSGGSEMKIDPTHRSQPPIQPTIDKSKDGSGHGDFGSILQTTLEKTSGSKECTASSIMNIRGPVEATGIQSGSEIEGEVAAETLLDKLERYRQLLADPAMTLRMIQPAVEQMEKQAAETRALVSGMPENHPLKTVVQDTISHITQEAGRFNSGYYVDGH